MSRALHKLLYPALFSLASDTVGPERFDKVRPVKENADMAEGSRVRVLLVDDDPTFLEALRTMFTFDERLEIVGEARDGEAAVRLANELQPDVVAMDIVMPGVDGIEATRAIRASRPETRVVLVSGSIFQERAEQGSEVAMEAGASGYVPKARAVVELADTVVSAAGSSDPVGALPAE